MCPDLRPGAGLGLLAAEAPGRAGVQDLLAPLRQVGPHLVDLAQQQVVLPGGEVPLLGGHRVVVDRPALRLPLGEPAIEHVHVLVAEQAKHPPGPRPRR